MRHEKKLLAVPVPTCPGLQQREREKLNNYAYAYHIRYAAETLTVDGEEVLAMTTFDVEGKPCRRFWQAGEQNGVEVFRKEQGYGADRRVPGRMYGAAIEHFYEGIPKSWYGGTETHFYGEPESADAVLRFLGKPEEDRDKAVELLAEFQRKNREAAIERRDEKKREIIRETFRGIQPGAPEGFKEWCEAVPMADLRYFFYTYTGRKEQEGICSYCGKRSNVAGIRNWKMGTCPSCGSRVKFWSLRRLNGSYGIHHRIDAAVCQMVNGRIVARCFMVGLDLTGAGHDIQKQMWASETRRCFLDGKTAMEQERFATPTGTTKVYVDGLSRDITYEELGPLYMAPMNIGEIRKSLNLYAPLEELAARGCAMNPVMVWNRVRKRPEVEYLIKLGLYRLAESQLYGQRPDVLNKGGKNVAELLGVPKETVNLLRNVDPSAKVMVTIRGLIRCGVSLTEQDMRDMNELSVGWHSIKRFQLMLQHLSVHKSLRYIRKQMELCSSFRDAEDMLRTWEDYLGMAMEVGKDIDDVHVALPKHLMAAHDETAKILRLRKDQKLNAEVAKSAERLRDLCWTWNGLTVRPAVSHEELFREGETLNHCVGRMGYAEKMAKFQTAIFFIRKEKEPDVPYVTLELDLKKLEKIQCYGKGDTWPGKLVDAFVAKWIKEVVKPARSEKQKKTA